MTSFLKAEQFSSYIIQFLLIVMEHESPKGKKNLKQKDKEEKRRAIKASTKRILLYNPSELSFHHELCR